jgi:hypothetical protein
MPHLGQETFKAVFLASFFALSACSSLGGGVSTARAPNVNLSQYKTFAWSEAHSAQRPPATIQDREIMTSVNHELTQKGLSPADDTPADLIVSYNAQPELNDGYNGGIYQGDFDNWEWGGSELRAPRMRRGALTLTLVDSKTNRVVWKGKASDVIGNDSDEDENQKQITAAVKDLFKEFPTV